MLDELGRREFLGRLIGGTIGAYGGYLGAEAFARDGSIDLGEHDIKPGDTARIRDPLADVVTTVTGALIGQGLGGTAARYRPKKPSI